jgi:V8-like Glu-specific endopeptidase
MSFTRFFLAGAVMACATAHAQDKPAISAIGDTPWGPGKGIPKVVYGTDDRIDVYQETDPERLAMAASTCALVNTSDLINLGNGSYRLSLSTYEALGGLAACANEPFGSQPLGAFCSGFIVGDDIIATAGHCLSNSGLGSTRIVFGFVMEDAQNVVDTFSASQIYTPVEILGRELTTEDLYDYTIVRVDRAITAPGAQPLPIRRAGAVTVGMPLGVIGHPAGLPMKIAFGPTTAVRSLGNAGFFVANTDTYGGNSGSPVFNAATGIVEGILVRGERDYVNNGGCFISNTVSDGAGRGEDVSRTTSFAGLVPELVGSAGTVSLGATAVACGASVVVTVRDSDLSGSASTTVSVTSTGGDGETFVLPQALGQPGVFRASVTVRTTALVVGDGKLQAASGNTLSFTYHDSDNGDGVPENISNSCLVDCDAPVISGVQVPTIGSAQATISFSTNEPASSTVYSGLFCGSLIESGSTTQEMAHTAVLNGLEQETGYYFTVSVSDVAGNVSTADNGGACFSFTTSRRLDYFTKYFESGATSLAMHQLLFTPTSGEDQYTLCVAPASALPTSPSGGTVLSLTDDGTAPIAFAGGKTFRFYGALYDEVILSANGFVTLDVADDSYQESLSQHFALKRISPFFQDLSPNARGTVSYKQTADRLAITFSDVPEYTPSPPLAGNSNTFQLELFFDGRIQCTYLSLSTSIAVVGLSQGLGVPGDFVASDLLAYPGCSTGDADEDGLPDTWEELTGLDPESDAGDDGAGGDPDGDGLDNFDEYLRGTHPDRADSDFDGVADGTEVTQETDPTGADQTHTADTSPDFRINLTELLRVIQFYNSNGFHCEAGTEDGFAPDGGATGCVRHNSDYIAPAFGITLSELLRLIQFYNSTGYTRDVYTEDSFAPL